MLQRSFHTGGFFHVYNRGVDKRNIFTDDEDFQRFINSMCKFQFLDQGLYEKKYLVKIIAFCLMNNHFHLLLEEAVEGGITAFMHKLGTGYTMYFNNKNTRKGRLFESVFKSVAIESNAHFLHITRYIHLNPVKGITDKKYKEKILNKYRWSSYLHYVGFSHYVFLDSAKTLGMFKNSDEYRDFMLAWE